MERAGVLTLAALAPTAARAVDPWGWYPTPLQVVLVGTPTG